MGRQKQQMSTGLENCILDWLLSEGIGTHHSSQEPQRSTGSPCALPGQGPLPSTHSLSRGFPLSRITSGRNTHSLQEKAVPAVSVVWPEDSNMTFRSKHRGSRCIRFPASGPFSLEGHCEWDNISGHIGLGFAKPSPVPHLQRKSRPVHLSCPPDECRRLPD